MNYLFLIYLYILSYNKLCFGEFASVSASVSASASASVSVSAFESTSPSARESIFENAYISQYPTSYHTLSPTTSCRYRIYNANTDFSNIQGSHGWYYGYNNNNIFTQFTNYGIATPGSLGNVNSWNFNINSNGNIGSSMIMPNGAAACNTASYGDVTPILRWYNPIGSCYQDVTIYFSVNHNSPNGGVVVQLTINGNIIYYNSNGGYLLYSNYFNGYGVNSIELSIGPLNHNCDSGQTSYSLIISPMGISNTVLPTFTNTPSNIPSVSSIKSPTNSFSIKNSISPQYSRSSSVSATATSTVFYTGNWSDLGQLNYAMADIPPSPLGSMTINQCQINCWLNPLCGLIVVTTPCNTISLDSPLIYTTICQQCWLKYTSGWVINVDTVSRSIMLHSRVYPPTSSSITTYSETVSSIPTPTLITYSSYNMCSNTGTSIRLPNLGSSVLLITNPIGTNYINFNNCNFYINGGSSSQVFRITIQSMNTEPCCDFLSVFDENNIQIIRYSGVYNSYSFLVSSSSINIQFTSDVSIVASGVVMLISLEYPTQSITSIPTVSNRPSPSVSKSAFNSRTNTISESLSKTSSYSISESKSISESNSIISSYTADPSISNSGSSSDTKLPSTSPSTSKSSRITKSPSQSNSVSYSLSTSPSTSKSSRITKSLSQSNSVSYSLSTSPSVTFSPSPSYSATPLPDALPFKLPPKDSNYNKALANQMNDYLNNLLLSDKILPPTQALAVINNIPSIGVSDTLNILKKIGGVISEPVIFSSASFEGKLAPIKNTTIQVSSNAYNISVPLIPNLPPNSAMVAISWSNTTSFSNETTLSNIMSVSVSNKGVDQSIKNLTTPIVLVWSISDIKIPPNMTLTCSYWNYTSKSWDSDGCNITINNNIECSCNHLTDFVARFERIAKMNENLFKNAGNVYSLEGLIKYQNYYIFYGVYFIIMILIGICLQQLDIKNSKQYLKSLKHNFDIIKFKKEINNFYIDKCKMHDKIDDFDDYNQYISHKHRLIRKIYNKINSHKNKQELIKLIDLFIDEELDNKHHGINTEDKQLSSDSNKNKKQESYERYIY
jgi:hypothetical protein